MYIDRELDCGECRLRAFRIDDAPVLARYANNANIARYLRDRFPHPYSTNDALRFFDYAERTRDECIACIEVNNQAVGAIGVQLRTDIERCSAELGYWLGEPFWGRGIMTATIRCFTSWAMPHFDLTRIYAEVFTDNEGSTRVLEKCDFVKVGLLRKAAIKHGAHHDYLLYDLVR